MKLLIQLVFLGIFSISSIHGATLSCTFSNSVCNNPNITAVTSANENIIVTGQPSTYVDNTTSGLSFSSPIVLNYVPTKLFNIFTNLMNVNFNNVSLTNLVSNAFTNCGKLTYIYLSYNNFPTVPASFASTCINVTNLMVQYNGIKSFDNEAFKGLTFLTMFYASYNNITCIPPGLFKNTPIIQYIDLSYNQISEIDPKAFNELPNLSSLSLGNNNIVNLPSLDLYLTGSTMSLSVSLTGNPINSINPTFITKLFTTRVGSMSGSVYISLGMVQEIVTCVPQLYSSIGSYNWPTANISLGVCYANWKSEYANAVSCAPPVTETTTKKYEGGQQWPFGEGKNFFAIISNAMKNFTASVNFY